MEKNDQKLLSDKLEKAISFQNNHQHKKAIRIFQEFIEIDTNNSEAHHLLGLSYLELKDFKKAILEFENSIQISPEREESYCNLGMAYWRNDEKEKAAACFRKKLSNQFIHINLAQLLLDMNKIEESLLECQKILEDNPNNYIVFFIIIMIEHRLCNKNIVLSSLYKVAQKLNISIDKWLIEIPEDNDRFLYIKGFLFILTGKYSQGLKYLRAAEKKDPGAGWIFTFKMISQIKQYYGPLITPNENLKSLTCPKFNYRGVISMNYLGLSGRLGHQLSYYLGLKLYAKRHNYCIEMPDWIGRYFFEGCSDPFISNIYDTINSTDPSFKRSIDGNYPPPQEKFNLNGSCFNPSKLTKEEKRYIQNTLTPLPYLKKTLDSHISQLKKNKKTLVSIHIRRGDFVKSNFYVPSSQLFLTWLKKKWPDLNQPVLYIASDEVEAVKADFFEFEPFSMSDFEKTFYFDDCLTDFYIISQSDIVITGASSFSRLATMCNSKYSQLYWANPNTNSIEKFNVWAY